MDVSGKVVEMDGLRVYFRRDTTRPIYRFTGAAYDTLRLCWRRDSFSDLRLALDPVKDSTLEQEC